MLHLGQSPAEVAEALVVSASTIYGWHKRWREGGIDGLANRPKSGRPTKATKAYVQLLEGVIEQEPCELGYDFTIWTTERLIAHMEQETGIRLGATQFRALLKKHDYVYRRPKHSLKELQDPDARAQADDWLAAQKKGPCEASWSSSLWMKPPSVSTPCCASAG